MSSISDRFCYYIVSRSGGYVSRQTLLQETELSKSSLTKTMDRLIQAGKIRMVQELRPGEGVRTFYAAMESAT